MILFYHSKRPNNLISFLLLWQCFLGVSISLSACKKTNPIEKISFYPELDTLCYNYDFPQWAIYSTTEQFSYTSPCINPNNDNEFIFILADRLELRTYIMKHNIITEETTEVTEVDLPVSELAWSREGWIAYCILNQNYNHQLWVIRDDGTQNQVFSPDNFYNNFPFWDDSGTHLYWTKVNNPDPEQPQLMLRKNIYTSIIDTLEHTPYLRFDAYLNKFLSYEWHNNVTERSIGYYPSNDGLTFQKENYKEIFRTTVHESPIYAKWSKTGEFLYAIRSSSESLGAGVFKIDLHGNKTLIKPICSSLQYKTISVSSNDDFLLMTKTYYFPDHSEPSVINFTSSIIKLNLITGEEETILPL